MVEASETAERAMLEDLNAAGEEMASDLSQHSRAIGSVYVSALGALPPSAIVANRAIGLGLGGKHASREAIEEIAAVYERAALDLGCTMIATETGEAVPGDPQTSYKNIVKMGFEPRYVRKNFAPPKP